MTNLTLVLWDIDHTLVETRGLGVELYRLAFERVTGQPLEHQPEITGRTEPNIFAETVRLHGIPASDHLAQRYQAALAHAYQEQAERLADQGRALPGARAALAALAQQPSVVQSVLTGNLRAVAMTKLCVFELDSYVDFTVGAYGEDAEERPQLVPIAQRRAGEKHGVGFDRHNTVIIGDSPSDVETGLKGGARVVAVASGESSEDELREAGASTVVVDLMETQRLAALVLGDAE